MAIANRLIFWYLLTLQNSVTQTVRSANAPYWTIARKWSRFSLVTISNAELATRSRRAWDERCYDANQRWQPTSQNLRSCRKNTKHGTPTRTQILCTCLCHLLQALQNLPGQENKCEDSLKRRRTLPGHEFQGFDCESLYIQMVSRNPSETWNEAVPPSPGTAWLAGEESREQSLQHEDYYDNRPFEKKYSSVRSRFVIEGWGYTYKIKVFSQNIP